MTRDLPVVLVVEDADEDFETVEEAVRRAATPLRLVRATSGDHCLDLLRDGGEWAGAPWLLLLDLNTPGTDGRDTLVALRQDERLRSLPIIVLSTSHSPRDVALCYARGANAYHIKPVQYPQHLQVLHDIFRYWLTTAEVPASHAEEFWP